MLQIVPGSALSVGVNKRAPYSRLFRSLQLKSRNNKQYLLFGKLRLSEAEELLTPDFSQALG